MRPETKRIRIGAVSYLNTKPLVYGLTEAISEFADLTFAVPSSLAKQLLAGEIDVGLIPAIEYFRNPRLKIISDACLACEGPVWSVQALFRKRPEDVQTLAIDEGSRTSVALTQILLSERYGITPDLINLPLDSSLENCEQDAMLVIGDRAMHLGRLQQQFVERWDLGQAWLEHTGLPFVFAMWVATPNVESNPNYSALRDALELQRDLGLQSADKIAAKYSAKYNLSESQIIAYLTKFLHYTITDRHREALGLYRDKANAIGLLRDAVAKKDEWKVPC